MIKNTSFAPPIFIVILVVGLEISFVTSKDSSSSGSILIAILSFAVALAASLSNTVANEWDRAVVLRLGEFRALNRPGFFLFSASSFYSLRHRCHRVSDRHSRDYHVIQSRQF
jgi:regulator of protease activity HflC (stomatin/prohibitin superfamily)